MYDTASSVAALGSDFSSVAPFADPTGTDQILCAGLHGPDGPLGYSGPLGPWGPLGDQGPLGGGAMVPSPVTGEADWSASAAWLTSWGGPLSAQGARPDRTACGVQQPRQRSPGLRPLRRAAQGRRHLRAARALGLARSSRELAGPPDARDRDWASGRCIAVVFLAGRPRFISRPQQGPADRVVRDGRDSAPGVQAERGPFVRREFRDGRCDVDRSGRRGPCHRMLPSAGILGRARWAR
jgi:hypothetical protein